ncbi:helix-turn-helix transcriptional regulator [Candidatus Pantoea soli]|uniref:AraC family transcriptional regulator n=1 Tax=Candidatus Pantoea soli TaxID=3098669 RepID=A0A518XJL9_9GAMM|nr:helix-turn-helix transcriptional regulator [Pantoea soli]QDY44384.1 AraC family transcriptional regulator [Pantoea soli]
MSLRKSVLKKIIEAVDTFSLDGYRLDDIAEFSGYSKWHLQRIFKEHTGISLGEYIKHRKMHASAHDLLDKDNTILFVALLYGYESQQTYTRAFKRYFGISPGWFRNMNSSDRYRLLKEYKVPKINNDAQKLMA